MNPLPLILNYLKRKNELLFKESFIHKILSPETFNAVIEGTFRDEWAEIIFKIAYINASENITVLNDGSYKYKLYGRTDDFENIQKVNGGAGILETKIESLAFFKGAVLSQGCSYMLERPRAVCMRDGRIFIEEEMAKDYGVYLSSLSSVVKTAGEIFKEKKALETYHKALKLYSKL